MLQQFYLFLRRTRIKFQYLFIFSFGDRWILKIKELLEKAVRQKGFFDQVRLDVLVAISDGGTISWPKSGVLPEVCKADQVHERINNRIEQFRKLRKEPDILTGDHRRVIADFLLKAHKPLDRLATQAAPPYKVEEPRPTCEVSPGNPLRKAPDIRMGREPTAVSKAPCFPQSVASTVNQCV